MSTAPERARVLHVAAESDAAERTARALEREMDVTVDTASRAETALDALADAEFACIVSDYDLPDSDGIEFLRSVREAYPDLPFVLFTDDGDESVASAAISNGATDYLRKGTADQFTILANRVHNAIEQYRARRRAANLDRIRRLVSDVNQSLIRADSRADVDQQVCEILSDSDPYPFAWIGGHDPETDRIEPRASAGVAEGYLDEITVTADERPTGKGPAGVAVREHRVAVSQDLQTCPEFAPWREEAVERGFRAVAAVPLVYESTLHGVLAVYADRVDAFDETERELLADLGDDIGHALHSIQVRERLRKEHDRRTALFENAPRPVVAGRSRDGDGHVVQDVNDAFEEVFGFSAETVVGDSLEDVVVPDDGANGAALRDRAVASESVATEVKRRTADGTREFLVDVIPYGTDETPADGWYTWYRDVTERNRREEYLERQKAKITALHDVATEIETCETADAVYDLIVEAAESILEFDIAIADAAEGEALVPKAVSSTLSGEQYYNETPVDAEDNFAARVYRTGEPSVVSDLRSHEVAPADSAFRSVITVPIGEYGVFQSVSKSIGVFDEDDLELVELLLSHARARLAQLDRERQLRERTEELERQNDRLDEFASLVSHDLRNPLNVAMGRLELARRSSDSEHLEEVAAAHDRMQTLIDDLLTLAREGKQVYETEPVALDAIAESCWRNVATADASLAVETDRTIGADSDRLKQLLENLLRNAVEHGGPDVTVTVGELDGGFYVADDGPGIPPEDRETVFESGHTTEEDGTGFGLAIVREAAQAHDWSVSVTESTDGGARFEFTGVDVVAS